MPGTCVPVNDDPGVTEHPLLDFSAGYVLRSIDQFPRAGSRAPWRLGMSYAHDVVTLRHGKINDGSMRFSRVGARSPRYGLARIGPPGRQITGAEDSGPEPMTRSWRAPHPGRSR